MGRDITRSIVLNAKAPVVWNALTDPEIIRQYLPQVETHTDWKVGSELVFLHRTGASEIRDKGMILDAVPNRLLRFTYWTPFSSLEDNPENYTTVTYRLTEMNGKTTLTVTQTDFKDEKWFRNSEEGWDDVLTAIKAIVEK